MKFCAARTFLVERHLGTSIYSRGSPGGWIKISKLQNTIGQFTEKIRMIALQMSGIFDEEEKEEFEEEENELQKFPKLKILKT